MVELSDVVVNFQDEEQKKGTCALVESGDQFEFEVIRETLDLELVAVKPSLPGPNAYDQRMDYLQNVLGGNKLRIFYDIHKDIKKIPGLVNWIEGAETYDLGLQRYNETIEQMANDFDVSESLRSSKELHDWKASSYKKALAEIDEGAFDVKDFAVGFSEAFPKRSFRLWMHIQGNAGNISGIEGFINKRDRDEHLFEAYLPSDVFREARNIYLREEMIRCAFVHISFNDWWDLSQQERQDKIVPYVKEEFDREKGDWINSDITDSDWDSLKEQVIRDVYDMRPLIEDRIKVEEKVSQTIGKYLTE
tara:strand:+ start:2234 stop:3151 length:918 start_codon:yes stop_codon:yes gene_type:complete